MNRSLRFRLAARTALGMTAALAAISLVGLFGARAFLDRELDASLMNVASIQAAAVTDAPSGAMHFHEWDLTPEEAARVRELNRYAQVWSVSGESLLRSQYIPENLPLDTAALQAAADGEIVLTEQRFQGFPIRSLYYPLERMGEAHARHVLQVAAPLTGRNRMLAQLAWLLLAIMLLAGAGSFVGGWWLARRVLRPVHEIIDQAEAIGAGTLGQRIEANADSQEYERLIRVLNSMLARLEASFDAQRRFTADASHELRSPLTALKGEIELALRRERDGVEYRRVLESNLEEVDRLARLADDLLTLARADAGAMRPRLQATDAARRIRAVAERLSAAADRKGVRIGVDAPGSVDALLDPGLFDRMLWNLLENAVKHSPEAGTIGVRLERSGDELVIEVDDAGPGIRPENRDRIFDRFFRADEARTAFDHGGGTGLGLSIVRAIVDAHAGRIEVGAGPRGGALFRVILPAVPRPGSPADERRTRTNVPTRAVASVPDA